MTRKQQNQLVRDILDGKEPATRAAELDTRAADFLRNERNRRERAAREQKGGRPHPRRPKANRVKDAMNIVDDDMPDGAYWQMVSDLSGVPVHDLHEWL